jgi:hypothetical protein
MAVRVDLHRVQLLLVVLAKNALKKQSHHRKSLAFCRINEAANTTIKIFPANFLKSDPNAPLFFFYVSVVPYRRRRRFEGVVAEPSRLGPAIAARDAPSHRLWIVVFEYILAWE